MNDKQKLFCDEYLIDMNATAAAVRAGYKGGCTGQRLAANPEIKAYIAARMEEKKQKLIADQDEILTYLTNVIRGATTSEVIAMEGIGFGETQAVKVQKAPDEKEKLKAAELLGKRYGLYSDKVNIIGAIPVVISGENELDD